MTRKKPQNPLLSDPVIEEVRRARSALWKSGGGTPEGFSRSTAKIAKTSRTSKRRAGSKKSPGKRAA